MMMKKPIIRGSIFMLLCQISPHEGARRCFWASKYRARTKGLLQKEWNQYKIGFFDIIQVFRAKHYAYFFKIWRSNFVFSMVIDAYLFIAHKIDEANCAPRIHMEREKSKRQRVSSSIKPQKTLKAVKISTRPAPHPQTPVRGKLLKTLSLLISIYF